MTLIGSYDINVNKNGIIKIPKKMRDDFGNKVLVSYNKLLGCINVIPINYWHTFKKVVQEKRQKTCLISDDFQTYLIDETGNLKIAQDFLHQASITDDCVVLGMGYYFELWNKEKLTTLINSVNPDDVEEQIGRLGF